jgi:hypothetical protein
MLGSLLRGVAVSRRRVDLPVWSRFDRTGEHDQGLWLPRDWRDAAHEGRSAVPSRVREPDTDEDVVKSSVNNGKLKGPQFVVGHAAGQASYTLPLAEVESCPPDCPFIDPTTDVPCKAMSYWTLRRYRYGTALCTSIAKNLDALDARHPNGYWIFLHVSGDFDVYRNDDPEYVLMWEHHLQHRGALNVWGNTHCRRAGRIGQVITRMNSMPGHRSVMRFSHDVGPYSSTTIRTKADRKLGDFVCIADYLKVGCMQCALCIDRPDIRVAFLERGATDVDRSSASAE